MLLTLPLGEQVMLFSHDFLRAQADQLLSLTNSSAETRRVSNSHYGFGFYLI